MHTIRTATLTITLSIGPILANGQNQPYTFEYATDNFDGYVSARRITDSTSTVVPKYETLRSAESNREL